MSIIKKKFLSNIFEQKNDLEYSSESVKFIEKSDLKSVNLQYITLGCFDDGTNDQESDVPSTIFLYFL
jgi:hypothetical protein